jgi:hypothetical protein
MICLYQNRQFEFQGLKIVLRILKYFTIIIVKVINKDIEFKYLIKIVKLWDDVLFFFFLYFLDKISTKILKRRDVELGLIKEKVFFLIQRIRINNNNNSKKILLLATILKRVIYKRFQFEFAIIL